MDKMDIDLVEVPDTPDRSTTRVIVEKSCPKEKKHIPSIPCHSAHHKFHEEGPRGRPIDIGSGSKRLFLRFPKCTSSSSSSLHPKKTKGVIEPNNSYQPQDSVHTQPVQIERPSCKSSSSYQNDTPVDLTDRVMHRPKKVSSLSGNDGERTDNTSRVGSTIGRREGVELVSNVQMKPGNNGFLSLDSIPRLNRQKKLVRNGCISPNNIAKAKELSGKESNSSVAVAQNNNASTESIDIMDLVAEDKNSYKGKGKAVLCQPCPSIELDSKNKHCLSRSPRSFCDKPKETNYHNWGLGTSIEESDGWISTRNRPRKKTLYLSDEEQVVGQQHRTGTGRTEKGSSVPTSGDCQNDPKTVSSQHTQPLRLPESNPRTRLRQLNGRQTTSTHVRRPKPEFADDPEVVLLSSPGEPSTSKSISRRANNPQLIIKVDDEFVPELRHSTEAEDARVRQLEADDRLARLLQEELYNEMPDRGAAMSDEQIALTLQHLDGSARASSRSNHPVPDARGFSNLPRRGSQSRASTLGRMTRLRSRFPGQPRTVLPSRGRTSRFPVNMDIDMRMHILGAMEAFSDMGVGPDILQTQRDFTENDYEMLLALDENNDRHAGASARLINGLPQSTIQSNTPVETCAICLETPTVGDSIRHLPCLHKFHKDCIDPWLRRRTSCPVCKSSIT